MTPLVSTEDLTKTYKLDGMIAPVLKGISLRVDEGEMISIMGPSGCGKSTLMHLLGLLDTPTSGRILFKGRDVGGFSEEERADFRGDKVGFVFQQFNLLKSLSSIENVLLPLVYSHRRAGSKERGQKLLEMVGLAHRLNYKTGRLSGGEQQRVAIARALINDPPLVLADEPTGNLDSQSGQDILNLLKSLNREGRTLVVVTHDARVAQNCRRIIQMKDGEIVES